MIHKPITSDITFQPSASLSVGQLVCIIQDYEPTASGTPRIGPALAVGRMTLPSRVVEGGTKGKALTLLHAWKDKLWEIGGGERPPRPRLLRGSPDGENDITVRFIHSNQESTAGGTGGTAETQPKTFENGDALRELSREGPHSQTMNEYCH